MPIAKVMKSLTEFLLISFMSIFINQKANSSNERINYDTNSSNEHINYDKISLKTYISSQ